MKILPITNIINNYKIRQTQPVSQDVQPSENLKPLACDTVSFGRCLGDRALKELLYYGIPDIYTGKIMIPFEELQSILHSKIFSLPLRQIVKILRRYEPCFQDVPAEIFELLKKQAKINPRDRLDKAIHRLVPEHNAKLVSEQRPIFDELKVIAQEMPEKQLKEFQELMDMTESQIKNEGINKPFDANDFRYKLQRIYERNSSKKAPQEQKVLRRIIRMASQFPSVSDEEIINRKLCKQNKNCRESVERRLTGRKSAIIRQMSRVIDSSTLIYDNELSRLISTAKFQLYNVKTVFPFQRKAFILELRKIADELEDTNLAHRLIQCATKLPNSSESISAFIVKSAESSSQKILYDLLYPSLGTIEHLLPSKSGGKDSLSNYALASSVVNSQRAHMGFANWVRKHPEVYENCQKYVDRLIELYNAGVFKKVGLSKDYITHFASLVHRMSPSEKPMVLDLSKLKK